jgi:hypothetical protein
LVEVGVPAGLLLGVDEIVVHDDLEDAAPARDERELRDLVLVLFQQPLRQTDGSRGVASLRAVLDRDPHGASV